MQWVHLHPRAVKKNFRRNLQGKFLSALQAEQEWILGHFCWAGRFGGWFSSFRPCFEGIDKKDFEEKSEPPQTKSWLRLCCDIRQDGVNTIIHVRSDVTKDGPISVSHHNRFPIKNPYDLPWVMCQLWLHGTPCDCVTHPVTPCDPMTSCDCMTHPVTPCELPWHCEIHETPVTRQNSLWHHVTPCNSVLSLWFHGIPWNLT